MKESVVNTDFLISIKEKHQEPTYLYDAEGNIAQTIEPETKEYDVIMKGGLHYNVDETEYNKLVKLLTE